MNLNIPQIYEPNIALVPGSISQPNPHRKRLAYLENAFDIEYELPMNGIYTASFALPAYDDKNQFCKQRNLVELYDGEKRIELFRIIGEDLSRSDDTKRVYECEHVIVSLIEKVLFRIHHFGGQSAHESTSNVLHRMLEEQDYSHQISMDTFIRPWQLGECDFAHQYQYTIENSNLLAAVFSVPQCFGENYIWTYDTTSIPWTINLKKPSEEIVAEARYQKNIKEIGKTTDSSTLVTRLYCLGAGEGDSQLTIAKVNDGVEYLEADTISTWGNLESILIDRRFTNAASLKAYGEAVLEEIKDPYVTYDVKAIDLHRLTENKHDEFVLGEKVRIIDEEDDITTIAPIVAISKGDVRGNPGEITITVANKERTLAGTVSDLQSRSFTNDAYSQGSNNLSIQNYTEEAVKDKPARFSMYFPDKALDISSVTLSLQFSSFPSQVKIWIDGVSIGIWKNPTEEQMNNIDLTDHLDKDEDGQIRRNYWHAMSVVIPVNATIDACLYTQLYTNPS